MTQFTSVDAAIEEFRKGNFVIIIDDEDRENEGDLACAAQQCTAEMINFMATYGRGLICVAMEGRRLDELAIPMMVANNTSRFETAFTDSVDAKEGTTTGISAADRACTIRRLVDPKSRAEDFVRPGHMFPIRAREGGVLVRSGQTEASVDLARLSGLFPAGVICEIMNEDGTMARQPQLNKFAADHGIVIVTIADLIRYRTAHEWFVRCTAAADLPSRLGSFTVKCYEDTISKAVHIVLQKGTGRSVEARAGARAFGMLHRRRARFAPVRMRRSAAKVHGGNRTRRAASFCTCARKDGASVLSTS